MLFTIFSTNKANIYKENPLNSLYVSQYYLFWIKLLFSDSEVD